MRDRHRRLQVGDQRLHLRLRLGREVLGDVGLADRLAERAVDGSTPRFQRGRCPAARERLAVELEMAVDEPLGEER